MKEKVFILDFSRVDCLVGFSMVDHVVDLVADGTREQNTCFFSCHFFKAVGLICI